MPAKERTRPGSYTDGAYPDVPAIDLSGTGIDLIAATSFNVTMNYDGRP